MPTTRQALFESIGDDVLTQLLATMSFADRSAINSVCKRWRKVVASPGFIQARRSVGETGLVILGYALAVGAAVVDGAAVVGRLRILFLLRRTRTENFRNSGVQAIARRPRAIKP